MDYRYLAYSFLKEESNLCDFEILTDLLSSDIALAIHYVKHISELDRLVYLVYHANGSLRGKNAISDDDLLWLSNIYDKYNELNGKITNFYLPKGCLGACHLHKLRASAKICARLAHRIELKEKIFEENIIKFFNLLANVLFLMAVYENNIEGYKEEIFISKSYEG